MKTIFDITPGFVWKSACEIVIKQGSTIYDGDVQLKEVLDLFIEVEDAEKNDVILEKMLILI